MTDFRALCAELHAAFNTYAVDESHHDLLRRARAALAEPQPAADGEVAATGKSGLQDGPAVQSREPASVIAEPSDEELRRLYCELFMLRCDPLSLGTGPVRFARAVLARWGTTNLAQTRSSLEPIPVSERLPEVGDCDAEGRCWGFHSYNSEDDNVWDSWSLVPSRFLPSSPSWIGWDYWLPFNALPLPKEVE